MLEMLGSQSELPDVAILDVSMPEMDGYDTTKEIRKQYPHIKIIGLSMFNNEYCIVRMLKNGADGYIHKNSNTMELKQAINDVYYVGYYYSKLATEKAFMIVKNNNLTDLLTKRELEFLCFCCDESLKLKKIAEKMFISESTAYDYEKKISEKLHLHSRLGLAIFAIHAGIYPL
jgi:two-component system, NarL family, invasion response regulator UvrY